VLGIGAIGTDLHAARDAAYRAVDVIDWPEGFCRRDIAHRAL
jgi:phosphoribosylamine--glycine ligase